MRDSGKLVSGAGAPAVIRPPPHGGLRKLGHDRGCPRRAVQGPAPVERARVPRSGVQGPPGRQHVTSGARGRPSCRCARCACVCAGVLRPEKPCARGQGPLRHTVGGRTPRFSPPRHGARAPRACEITVRTAPAERGRGVAPLGAPRQGGCVHGTGCGPLPRLLRALQKQTPPPLTCGNCKEKSIAKCVLV